MKLKQILLLLSFFLVTFNLDAQTERPLWELGGGLRLNYLGLDGGMSGYRASDGYKFDMKYKDIGMDNYSPSLAITLVN